MQLGGTGDQGPHFLGVCDSKPGFKVINLPLSWEPEKGGKCGLDELYQVSVSNKTNSGSSKQKGGYWGDAGSPEPWEGEAGLKAATGKWGTDQHSGSQPITAR